MTRTALPDEQALRWKMLGFIDIFATNLTLESPFYENKYSRLFPALLL
jgi:hypothetical protein